MSALATVRRTIHVGVDPATAFAVFTEEIGSWWRHGPFSHVDPSQAVTVRIEPGVGGRWLEVWDARTGDGYERGRITRWEPPLRIVMDYRHPALPDHPLTEIEVGFEPTADGTRVTLEHRGWEQLPPEVVARYVSRQAWGGLARWYRDYVTRKLR